MGIEVHAEELISQLAIHRAALWGSPRFGSDLADLKTAWAWRDPAANDSGVEPA